MERENSAKHVHHSKIHKTMQQTFQELHGAHIQYVIEFKLRVQGCALLSVHPSDTQVSSYNGQQSVSLVAQNQYLHHFGCANSKKLPYLKGVSKTYC